ncbi:hypothetical protein OG21DRAFT_1039326 [Imleria badia]|nr:hypothetical protein OG21DRAFT_1039326 [Imleria badia]
MKSGSRCAETGISEGHLPYSTCTEYDILGESTHFRRAFSVNVVIHAVVSHCHNQSSSLKRTPASESSCKHAIVSFSSQVVFWVVVLSTASPSSLISSTTIPAATPSVTSLAANARGEGDRQTRARAAPVPTARFHSFSELALPTHSTYRATHNFKSDPSKGLNQWLKAADGFRKAGTSSPHSNNPQTCICSLTQTTHCSTQTPSDRRRHPRQRRLFA